MARMNRTTLYKLDGSADNDYTSNNRELKKRLKESCRLSYVHEDVTAEKWAQNLRDTEIPKHDFVADMMIQNWDIWKYWFVMKFALKIPHIRNTYTRYIASDNYPYFPAEYKDWHKFSKNIPDTYKSN